MTSAVVSHKPCPRCRSRGQDRHGDNLGVYNDGHTYCFKCGHYGHPSSKSLNHLAKKIYKHVEHGISQRELASFRPDTCTYNLPSSCLQWLRSYNISTEDIQRGGFWYDSERSSLCMPVYNGSELVHISRRYFGTNADHPKYVTQGFKSGYFKLILNLSSDYICLVEDHISAIRVSHSHSAIPLMGTFAPRKLILRLLPMQKRLRFWLDRNAAEDAMKQANKALQFHQDCGTIITEKDPKCYSDKEINDFVLLSSEGIP